MDTQPHVVMFPYPLQGHINPLFSLARYLASSGILVTFVHSQANYNLLLSAQRRPLHSLLHVEFLPETTPTRSSDPSFEHSMQKFEMGLLQLMQKLSNEKPPMSCLISDILMPWTHHLATKFGILKFEFSAFSAFTLQIAYHLQDIMDRGFLPFRPGTEDEVIDFIPGIAPFRVADIPVDFLERGENDLQSVIRSKFDYTKDADGLLVNSVYDLEESAVNALRAEQIVVCPIGPLLPCIDGNSMGSNLLSEDEECLQWLDGQADCSVLYVAFGSLSTLSIHEFQELALGLEECRQPFLWVIRPNSVSGAVADNLPLGFTTRTAKRCRIISWAPQLAVLSHRSISVFLCHCGFSSVLESLWMGVPMIGYPTLSDQNTNLKLITDWGVGISLKGHGKLGIDKFSVEAAVRALMQGEEGMAKRRRAIELKERMRISVAEDGHSKVSLEKFVERLKQPS